MWRILVNKGVRHMPMPRREFLSDEQRRKLSECHKGQRHPQTPETRAKIAASHKGMSPTKEARAKIAATLTGRPSPHKGKPRKPHTQEIKAKQSTALMRTLRGRSFKTMIQAGVTDDEMIHQRSLGNVWCWRCLKWFTPDASYEQGPCPECAPEYYRVQTLSRHGVDSKWYAAKLAEQGNGCALCGGGPTVKDERYLCVDHDHATNKVRGLLCKKCNTLLGYMENNPGWVDRALAYLAKYR